MKANKILLAILIALAILSCSNEQATNQSNSDELLKILSDSNWVEVTDTLSIDITCLDGQKIAPRYFINDSNEYKKLLDIRWQYYDCTNYELPFIDFSQFTLVGHITKTNPTINIKRSIYKNDIDKKYLYIIEITLPSGFTEDRAEVHNNWLLIRKIPNDFTIDMDTIMKYN